MGIPRNSKEKIPRNSKINFTRVDMQVAKSERTTGSDIFPMELNKKGLDRHSKQKTTFKKGSTLHLCNNIKHCMSMCKLCTVFMLLSTH